ncbi:MAG TPA: FKBP-type peptidyl-prolyl cis-trans isomerase [Gemmatimonadaceae bacterium]|jgi:peptidylprolyl isomerase
MINTNIARVVAISALALSSACLGGESIAPERSIEETSFASALGVNLAASTKTPNGAYYRDIVVGTGAVVAGGQTISIRYTGWLSNGFQFETNVSSSNPLVFKLGAGEVIDGFDEALAGVRVGGRRQLIIPPSLGYGPYDYGPIPGNSILVFNVEVVAAQ